MQVRPGWKVLFTLSCVGTLHACTNNAPLGAQGQGEGATGPEYTFGGAGGAVYGACRGEPDGECRAYGADQESCACGDCATTALCQGYCNDDTVCIDGVEDCTCADCYLKVESCAPEDNGCGNASDDGGPNGDGTCNLLVEDCTCGDCLGAAACSACDNNGQCIPARESCACADCAATERCGGTGSGASTSSGSGGAGGELSTGSAGGGGESSAGGAPSGVGGEAGASSMGGSAP